ncbi:hypothetical protein P7K49_028598 [Saguinus oedipus]|uniref:Uncharacterized protein n=1 Tax=Saguinus oedipus TaxID=9490 RepID=A0ABQ9U5K4_SAGOE|nr:hypothetical protein P7K49_028598 [Saguinus oedipus]
MDSIRFKVWKLLINPVEGEESSAEDRSGEKEKALVTSRKDPNDGPVLELGSYCIVSAITEKHLYHVKPFEKPMPLMGPSSLDNSIQQEASQCTTHSGHLQQHPGYFRAIQLHIKENSKIARIHDLPSLSELMD